MKKLINKNIYKIILIFVLIILVIGVITGLGKYFGETKIYTFQLGDDINSVKTYMGKPNGITYNEDYIWYSYGTWNNNIKFQFKNNIIIHIDAEGDYIKHIKEN